MGLDVSAEPEPDPWAAIRPHVLRVDAYGHAVLWEREDIDGRTEVTATPGHVYATYIGPRGGTTLLYSGSVEALRSKLKRERDLLDAIEHAMDIASR